jgi:hypothetical protein
MRVFENRVLRRISGPSREQVVGGWIKLHNIELHNLFTSPNIIRVIKSRSMGCAGHVANMGEMRNSYTILVRKTDGNRPFTRRRQRWEDSIRMYLTEVG